MEQARNRRRKLERLVKSSTYDLASFSCSKVRASWIWSNSARTQVSLTSPLLWSFARVCRPCSTLPWSMSHLSNKLALRDRDLVRVCPAYLGDSGKNMISSASTAAGAIWIPNGILHCPVLSFEIYV